MVVQSHAGRIVEQNRHHGFFLLPAGDAQNRFEQKQDENHYNNRPQGHKQNSPTQRDRWNGVTVDKITEANCNQKGYDEQKRTAGGV